MSEKKAAEKPTTAAAAAAPQVASNEPAKRVDRKKPKHPALEGGKKIKAVPPDWSTRDYADLKASDFEDSAQHVFMRHRAAYYRRRAEALEKQAKMVEEFGTSADLKKAQRFLKMQEQFAALKKQLEDAGLDVDALVAADE